MKKILRESAAALLLIVIACLIAVSCAGCEHINFEFDWQMLAESVFKQCGNNSK